MIRDDFRPMGGFRTNLRRILHADGHRIAAPAGVNPHRGHQAGREVAGRHPGASGRHPGDLQ